METPPSSLSDTTDNGEEAATDNGDVDGRYDTDKSLSNNPTNWSNRLKQFVYYRRIV